MQGTGSVSSPYLVSTPQDVHDMRNYLAQGIYFEFTNDIDMASWGDFTPISYYDQVNWINGFSGNVDGKGYVVKNLTINKSTGIYMGLFGQYNYGTCQNLGLENVNVNANSSTGLSYSGSLAGSTYSATFKNCYVNGGKLKAIDESGGLFGKLNASTVEDCYSNIEVVITSAYYGGGLGGSIDTGTFIRRSYSMGKVSYTQPSSPWNGKSGFVGFVRDNTVVFENCFYDKETSMQSGVTSWGSPPNTQVVGVTGKTTSQMKTQSTYTGWDFTNTWLIQSDYPKLSVFGIPDLPPQLITINLLSTMNPFGSTISRKAKTVKELTSYANAILSDSKRSAKTFKNVEGYSLPFDSNATVSHRTVRSSRQDVTSFMSPIYAYASRESKTVKHLLATMNPLWGSVDVYIPMNTKGAYAYCEVIQNPSNVSVMSNRSYSELIQNPSYCEVI